MNELNQNKKHMNELIGYCPYCDNNIYENNKSNKFYECDTCDSYVEEDEIKKYKTFNRLGVFYQFVCECYEDYLRSIKRLYTEDENDNMAIFNDLQQWEAYFNAELKSDEETGEYLETLQDFNGNVRKKPNENKYPLLLSYIFDREEGRAGMLNIRFMQYKSLSDLGLLIKK